MKIGVGLSRGKPVGLLVMLCIFATVLALVACARPVRLSRRGRRTLADLKEHHHDLKTQAPDSTDFLPLGVALFGTTVLTAYGFSDLAHTLRPLDTSMPTSDSGSGCGSSGGGDGGGGGDSGGGDSGGGSGCGGCGGGGGGD